MGAVSFFDAVNDHLKQAFIYLKEGEYFFEIGRYNSSIIQFAIILEYLIDYQLNLKGMIDEEGKYKKPYIDLCNNLWKKKVGKSNYRIPFSFRKYVYVLSEFGFALDRDVINAIDSVYKTRNKLAHGYDLYETFKIYGITIDDGEPVTEYNVWDCFVIISQYMTKVYNFFVENFKG